MTRPDSAMPTMPDPSIRERIIAPERAALLLIDLQNLLYDPQRLGADPAKAYFLDRMARIVIPNNQRLLAACRSAGMEIVYAVIECLTRDGRDRGPEFKTTGFYAAKGSWEAHVIDALSPGDDDIVIGKTATGVFNSTNIEYVLRNLGVEHLVVTGVLTDHCVESSVRAASDRGFLATLAEDACATYSQERHDLALPRLADYCRVRSTSQAVGEISQHRRKRGAGRR